MIAAELLLLETDYINLTKPSPSPPIKLTKLVWDPRIDEVQKMGHTELSFSS